MTRLYSSPNVTSASVLLCAGIFLLELCSSWPEKFWTCMTRLTWERNWACTSSRSCRVCLCTASSCCLSSSSSSLEKTPSLISVVCCRLLSSHWPRHLGMEPQEMYLYIYICIFIHYYIYIFCFVLYFICMLRPLQLSHFTNHHEVSSGELRCGSTDRSLRAARGSYHQHGWNGSVRGCGRHLYRSGQ